MKIVKKIGILLGAVILAVGMGACQAADSSKDQVKVAVVNVQQVLQQSPRVAELSKKLEDQFKKRQAKIGDEQKALQSEMEKFKKESPTMSSKVKSSMEKKISDDRATLVKKVVAYQQDLQKEQNKVMQGVLADLNSVVSQIAKGKYNLVLEGQAVIYGGEDITSEVAKKFDKK